MQLAGERGLLALGYFLETAREVKEHRCALLDDAVELAVAFCELYRLVRATADLAAKQRSDQDH